MPEPANGDNGNQPPIDSEIELAIDPEAERKEQLLLVRRLRLQGLTIKEVAAVAEISERTVYNRLNELRDEARKRAATAEHWQELGGSISRFEDIYDAAWQNYHRTTDFDVRAKMLKIAAEAETKRATLMMDTGVIRKVPTQIQHTEVPLTELSIEELKRRRVQIVEEILEGLPAEDVRKLIPIIMDKKIDEADPES